MKPFMIKALIASAAALAALPAAAQAAPMTITSFDSTVSTTQAGAHPDATVAFEFSHHNVPDYNGMDVDTPDESVRNVVVDLPSGFIGDPPASRRARRTRPPRTAARPRPRSA